MMTAMFLLMLTGAVSGAPAPMATPVADEAQSREQALYTKGTAALDGRDWDEAARAFADAAALKGERADAALYWRAYALHKSGRRDLALQALATLKTTYPRSRWMKDARALDLETVRPAASRPPRTPRTPTI